MRITMVGSGYVGLVSGACFSDFGHEVTCVDKDASKIAALNAGQIPIFEPGLDHLVQSNVTAGRLSFTTDIARAVRAADAVFIAVGTPSRRGDGYADLYYVYGAAVEIAAALDGFTVIVDKSTVPVGTGDEVERIIRESNPAADFAVISNPEFLREGAAIGDFKHPDRIVIGGDDERGLQRIREIYRPLFLGGKSPLIEMSRRGAELTKYAGNAFLATKITFINEIADLCEKVGADVQDIAHGIGLDGHIGRKFLHPGSGYGGSCFPKDTVALIKTAEEADAPMRIVEAVVAVNEARKLKMAQRIEAAFGGVSGKTVALLGLTFKPNTDDMREAPSLVIAPYLQQKGAHVRAFDPEGGEEARKLLQIEICDDAYETLEGADGVVILTEWNEFRALDLKRAKKRLKTPLMVDLRNIYRPEQMAAAGFRYVSVGRADVNPT